MKLPIGIQDFEKMRTGGNTIEISGSRLRRKQTYLMGVNFSRETRTIDKYIIA